MSAPWVAASSLRELLRVRVANAAAIDRLNGTLGSALGFKYRNGVRTNRACIIVFVPRKLPLGDVAPENRPPEYFWASLDGVRLWCPSDIVEGGKAQSYIHPPRPGAANRALVGELQGPQDQLRGGIQIGGFFDSNAGPGSAVYMGTVACGVRDRAAPHAVGLLTNQHVALTSDGEIHQPAPSRDGDSESGSRVIGTLERTFEYVPDEEHYDHIVNEANAYVRVDCAFVKLKDAAKARLEPGVHSLTGDGAGQGRMLGEVMPVDLDSMSVIGTEVTSVGRTRGKQSGIIYAYAYEHRDHAEFSVYTDFLIISDEPEGVFSDKGDSGKLIVTKDGLRPVALLWGGWDETLRNAHGRENWTYAIELQRVLDTLNVDIYTGAEAPEPPEPEPAAAAPGLGFDPTFVKGATLPSIADHPDQVVLSQALAYTHFSLVVHRTRRLAVFVAHNVDGTTRTSVGGRRKWKLDGRLPAEEQLDNSAYIHNDWDRGHLARRAAVAWGASDEEAEKAASDSDHYTNAAPQHKNFNQDEWLGLEDYVLGVAADHERASVYTGPVLAGTDPAYRGYHIPMAFWKVIVFKGASDGNVHAAAFLMKQAEMWEDRRGRDLLQLRTYQVPVKLIEDLTGVTFSDAVRDADAFGSNAHLVSASERALLQSQGAPEPSPCALLASFESIVLYPSSNL